LDIALDVTDEQLADHLTERFATEPRDIWLRRLSAAQVPAHAQLDLGDLIAHPLLRQRGILRMKEHPGMGAGLVIGPIARFASQVDRVAAPAARPGWHSKEILAEVGFSEQDVEDMISENITVGTIATGLCGLNISM
jgi:crotonobetainyl-CoA:carnitine CoA-transferase CaiB-like acyl-CoA transferase